MTDTEKRIVEIKRACRSGKQISVFNTGWLLGQYDFHSAQIAKLREALLKLIPMAKEAMDAANSEYGIDHLSNEEMAVREQCLKALAETEGR